MIETNFANTVEQATAFQKIWMESVSKTMQAALTVTPNMAPSEMLLQIRGGIFKALGESWESFMRSPQFLQGMQQFLEQTTTFRKMTNDLLGKIRSEAQAPSREDVDAIMVSVRHIEKRMLDRIEELSSQIEQLTTQVQASQHTHPEPRPAAAKRKPHINSKTTMSAKKGVKS